MDEGFWEGKHVNKKQQFQKELAKVKSWRDFSWVYNQHMASYGYDLYSRRTGKRAFDFRPHPTKPDVATYLYDDGRNRGQTRWDNLSKIFVVG